MSMFRAFPGARPPEKLETKGAGMLKVTQNQFLESLPRLEGGWFANTALEPTAITPVRLRFGRRFTDAPFRRGSAFGR